MGLGRHFSRESWRPAMASSTDEPLDFPSRDVGPADVSQLSGQEALCFAHCPEYFVEWRD
jgi:hypothetical protein